MEKEKKIHNANPKTDYNGRSKSFDENERRIRMFYFACLLLFFLLHILSPSFSLSHSLSLSLSLVLSVFPSLSRSPSLSLFFSVFRSLPQSPSFSLPIFSVPPLSHIRSVFLLGWQRMIRTFYIGLFFIRNKYFLFKIFTSLHLKYFAVCGD